MGSSPYGRLIYGYDIGGDDVGWHIAEYDQDRYELTMPWLREETDDPDDDFVTRAEKLLLTEIAGFTETDWRSEGCSDRLQAAKERIGVCVTSYGHYDAGGHALATHEISMEWDCSDVLNLAELAARPAAEGWDDRLAAAVRALSITPSQERPGWLLCAEYS
jgi:hypothetical protein